MSITTIPAEIELPAPSISINAAMVARHQNGDLPIGAIDTLTAAAQVAADACHGARDGATAIMNNRMAMPLANRRDASKVAEQHSARMTRAIDRARKDALTVAAELEAKITPKPSPVGSEIRARLAAMSNGDRRKILAAADEQTIAALMGAPSWLAGVTDADRSVALNAWQRRNHADALDQRERILAAVEAIDKVGTLSLSYLTKLVDGSGLEEAEAAAARARAVAEAAAAA